MIDELIQAVRLSPETAAEALSALVGECRREAGRREVDSGFSDRTPLNLALSSPEPKVRKNAARLMGALKLQRDSEVLQRALEHETTRFVIPSILLALGSCGGIAARHAISDYVLPKAQSVSEEKHCREIEAAYRKASAALFPKEIAVVEKLDAPRELLLIAPEGFSTVLMEELTELGLSPKPHARGAVVVSADLNRVFLARCFTELVYPIAQGVPVLPERIAPLFAHDCESLPYRVELRGYADNRTDFIEQLVRLLPGENAPSHYAIELRIECEADIARLSVRPWNVPDKRFSYRKHALPASMHPALAACIVRYAQRYAGDTEANVLDACCGSGTLLFERELLSPCATLFGVDIAPNAVTAAKANAGLAGSDARFIQKDLRKFMPREPVDELYMNLPFGNRVGTHENNERLYRDLLTLLPLWLNDGGIAVLYTMEYRLLSKLLSREKRLVQLEKRRTEAGGLLPWLFIVGKAK